MTGLAEACYPDPPLGDDLVGLRRWSLHDLDCVAAASTDSRITDTTSVPAQWSVGAGREFIERQWKRVDDNEGISLAVEPHELGRAIGLVSMMLRPQPGVIGLGYWITPEARGNRFASRAVQLASAWATGPGGFPRIEAWVEPDNLGSQSVLSAAGFHREGRLRSFLAIAGRRSDALVYSKLASP